MRKLIFYIPLFLFAGCNVGPNYVPPCIEVPIQWKNTTTLENNLSIDSLVYREYWWEIFEDDRLNDLEIQVLNNNNDLYIACQRVQEARDIMGVAASQFYPQVFLNPQYTSTGELIKNYINPKNQTLLTSTEPFRVHELFYFFPIVFGYEVDLWGKIRDQYNAAKYRYFEQKENYNGVMLSLTANLAIAYYRLRTLDQQLDLLTNVLKTRLKALEINQARYDDQITYYADVTLAQEEVDTAQILYNEAGRQRMLLEDQIAVLIGRPASEINLEHMPLEGSPPEIPSGIPSEVLLRRPDILAAEDEMKATHYTAKYVYAQFFPSLNLTSQLGFESPVLKEFLKWISRYWMVGVSSRQIAFDGFRTSYQFKAEVARFEQATGQYQQRVLQAFQEVEDTLSNIDSYGKQYEIAADRAVTAQKTNQIFTDRYGYGLTNYINVTNTERDALNFQIDANTLQGLRFISTIQFIQAIGGSW